MFSLISSYFEREITHGTTFTSTRRFAVGARIGEYLDRGNSDPTALFTDRAFDMMATAFTATESLKICEFWGFQGIDVEVSGVFWLLRRITGNVTYRMFGRKEQPLSSTVGNYSSYWPFGAGIIFLILAHPVYKMRIILEPNTLELWNKLHSEEKKQTVYTIFKIFSTYICWINI